VVVVGSEASKLPQVGVPHLALAAAAGRLFGIKE
jgi:hypothetical protein